MDSKLLASLTAVGRVGILGKQLTVSFLGHVPSLLSSSVTRSPKFFPRSTSAVSTTYS